MTKATRVVLRAGKECSTEWAEPWLTTDDNGGCPIDDDGSTEWGLCHEKIGKNNNTRWYTGGSSDIYGDVDGQVLEQGKYCVSFSCFNPWLGYPLVVFNSGGMGAYAFQQSDHRARLSEGESYEYVSELFNSGIKYKHIIKRLDDTDYKEFEVWIAVEKVS